ncbi:MAG: hypothetical protein QNJ51_14470 [Calothrix sp. MO_167.B12]|nr:hypothetical protein [Calothrix sp. MO_167.B12]
MKDKRQNIVGKTIALLLTVQIFLVGLQAKSQIEDGELKLEVLIWMIQQSIPALKHIQSLQEKGDKNKR